MTLTAAVMRFRREAYLKLNFGLGNILLAAATVHNLLRLGDLGADSLGAKVLEGITLNGVDAQGRLGLDDGKTTGNCDVLCKPKLPSTSGLHLGTYGKTACCCRPPQ